VVWQSLPPQRRGGAGERRPSEEPCLQSTVRPARRAALLCDKYEVLLDGGVARRGQQCRHHVFVGTDVVADGAGLDDAGPADEGGDAEATFPLSSRTSRRKVRARLAWDSMPTAWVEHDGQVGQLLAELKKLGIDSDGNSEIISRRPLAEPPEHVQLEMVWVFGRGARRIQLSNQSVRSWRGD
jgi:hypothetical protein